MHAVFISLGIGIEMVQHVRLFKADDAAVPAQHGPCGVKIPLPPSFLAVGHVYGVESEADLRFFVGFAVAAQEFIQILGARHVFDKAEAFACLPFPPFRKEKHGQGAYEKQ